MSYLSVAISVLGVLVALYRQFWSDAAMLKTLQLKLESLKSRQAVEAERLKATYARIEREPHKFGNELADQLNKSSEDLRR